MGGEAVRLPVLAIEAVPIEESALPAGDVDFAFFVSRNAVLYGYEKLPKVGAIVAVGSSTAEVLAEQGANVALQPRAGFTSEALLALPELQSMQGQRVLIVRGVGGRETLARELSKRGATVDYLEVYRRIAPEYSDEALARRLGGEPVDVVAITSVEGLENLRMIAGQAYREWLQSVPLLLGSERIRDKIKQHGLEGEVILATDPTDPSMLMALKQWAEKRADRRGM